MMGDWRVKKETRVRSQQYMENGYIFVLMGEGKVNGCWVTMDEVSVGVMDGWMDA